MAEVGQYRQMTAMQLYDHMKRFVSDNASSNDVDVRWLAARVADFSPLAADVANSRLGPMERKAVNDFRAAEIERELEKKRRELDVLERSLKQIKAA